MFMNNMKRNTKSITIRSFLKEWFKNTNEEIIIDYEKNISVKNKNMRFFYEEFLIAFLNNSGHYRIVGCDLASSFKINFSEEETMLKIAQDIWDNPHDYFEFGKKENPYYEFLKFLWIETPNGEMRLADCVNTSVPEENKLK